MNVAAGDCNEFAVQKRHELIARGWPAAALALTVVKTSWGEGHLIVTVRTDQGDLVLDNLRSDIVPWQRAGYHWIMRQSERNPQFWVDLEGGRAGPAYAADTLDSPAEVAQADEGPAKTPAGRLDSARVTPPPRPQVFAERAAAGDRRRQAADLASPTPSVAALRVAFAPLTAWLAARRPQAEQVVWFFAVAFNPLPAADPDVIAAENGGGASALRQAERTAADELTGLGLWAAAMKRRIERPFEPLLAFSSQPSRDRVPEPPAPIAQSAEPPRLGLL